MRSFLFRLIGILEIAGGLYGVGAMLRRLWPLGSTLDSLHALIGLVLFGFVLAAGILLVDGQERGVRLSGWAQLLQLPLVATPVFSYALHCGAYLNLYTTAHLARPWLEGSFGTQGYALAVAGPSVARFGVNLLALLSWLVLKLR
ncbi:hypothetical protein [Fulvimonas soli]|jgi:hypothetical protein|uniref:Uncharacterized protein n=1 Tax=Fulvimonas soli TaxID=155197 RepID=A0A316HZU6_9GAMM|nr:hypothetical protein [Fulvimonas soli]PWK86692.1 hypothetical protein C7456_10783 [Fulvimonas soli]TNY25768.1 hypothetical protein BV497_12260 [Fulvimonas soli]